jgi:hypothetical protein
MQFLQVYFLTKIETVKDPVPAGAGSKPARLIFNSIDYPPGKTTP